MHPSAKHLSPFLVLLLTALTPAILTAQESDLTVSYIMQDQLELMGGLPGRASWSESGDQLYFWWNPEGQFPGDSMYAVSIKGGTPTKVSPDVRRSADPRFGGWNHSDRIYSEDFKQKLYADRGDLYLHNRSKGKTTRLTLTSDRESNPQFMLAEGAFTFMQDGNYYKQDVESGVTIQLTDYRSGKESADKKKDEQDTYLSDQELRLFQYTREQKAESEEREAARERDQNATTSPSTVRYGSKSIGGFEIHPSAQYVSYVLSDRSDQSDKNTMSVRLVTESGYPEQETWRRKVGTSAESPELWIHDVTSDTTYQVDLHILPGMYDVPAYLAEQGVEVDSAKTKRVLEYPRVSWSPDGRFAIVDVNARDNKDRWIARLDAASGTVSLLDRQHDDAWIGGPGMYTTGWIPGTSHFYFQSERTGYSHLYTVDLGSGQTRQLTDGKFEVFNPELSRDAKSWTFTSSEVSPFVRHFYKMKVNGGKRTQLTRMDGKNSVTVNPDGKTMAILRSYTNKPTELYIGDKQITKSPKSSWQTYDWRAPEIVNVPASDGVDVPAQLFVPETANGAAVIFVHGAGYLQNVHHWWSSYSREYMFNNLLTDLGYYVINVDYRASAGYGRDWRTAIYRHMGGRDLQDQVDASRYLNSQFGIDPERVAVYGGSYGGFIALMALFTESEHFGAAAALRSVTDWAHYNHGYTANILNTPATDSLAYARSSPINFAEGLEDPLVMPHGMLDNNVHFQDIIRLTQKLIELGKEDWELAVYPVERHGFSEPASWTDEYRRILKLIEEEVGPGK